MHALARFTDEHRQARAKPLQGLRGCQLFAGGGLNPYVLDRVLGLPLALHVDQSCCDLRDSPLANYSLLNDRHWRLVNLDNADEHVAAFGVDAADHCKPRR